MTQEIIVYVILSMTVLLVSLRTFRKVKAGAGSTENSSCGDCCGCSASSGIKSDSCSKQ
ncbi:MAG: hypothetical protein ACM3SM_11840 [Bacteroidota bacterium]